jgi:hypothetical protein
MVRGLYSHPVERRLAALDNMYQFHYGSQAIAQHIDPIGLSILAVIPCPLSTRKDLIIITFLLLVRSYFFSFVVPSPLLPPFSLSLSLSLSPSPVCQLKTGEQRL